MRHAIMHPTFPRSGLLCVLLANTALADETRHFDWLTSGRVSGHHIITVHDDGSRAVDYTYTDRGRGPETREITRFDAQGRIAGIDIRGHAYMGAEVQETFERTGDAARWESQLESASTDRAGGAFYLAVNGTSEQFAILARALLDAPGQSLPLLPTGHARIRKLDSALVGPEGGKRQAHLYAIEGLDLQPSYLWLDDDRELFALSVYWMGLVPAGWAAYLPELTAIQHAAESRLQKELAERLTQRLPDEYAIENVHVVDVENGDLLAARRVIVRDGRIAALEPVSSRPFNGHALDGGGGYLMPGLWDMHTHLAVEQGIQHIAGGVTTVRDVGNNVQELQHVRQQFDSGDVIGPHVIAAGFIDRKSPFSAPIGPLVETRAQALDQVRQYAEMGYRQIKLYSSIEPRWVKKIARRAHELGMRVSGHVPNGMNARQVINAGFDEIQHINMLFLYFLADETVDTRTAERITLVAEAAAGLDLDSRKVGRFLAFLREKGTVVDPTVALFHGMLQHAPGEVDPSYAMIASHLPPTVQRKLRNAILVSDAQQATAQADDAEALVRMVGMLHRAGVRLVAGTDATPGFLYHRELELYAMAGIPHAEVLRIATLGAAEVMGMAGANGSVAPGKQADLLVLADNPLNDISAVRRARLVIKGQQAWKPAELHRAMGITPFITQP